MWLCTSISVGRSCSDRNECSARATRFEVVHVRDGGDVPAVADEAGRDVLSERDVGVALDRHPVGVVDPAQVGQLQMAGERGGLREMPSIMQPSPAGRTR